MFLLFLGLYRGFVEDELEVLKSFYDVLHDRMNWFGFEFTLPADLWSVVSDDDLCWLRSPAVECVSEVLSEGGRYVFGGEAAAQWSGYTNPFEGPKPHVHLTFWDHVGTLTLSVLMVSSAVVGSSGRSLFLRL